MTGFEEIDVYLSDLDRTIVSIFDAEPVSPLVVNGGENETRSAVHPS
jgi:hypothetical protein